MSTKYSSLRRIAYHEAGHAFAIYKFGFRSKKATIVANSYSAGRVEVRTGLHMRTLDDDNPSAARIARIHEWLVVALAGIAAQRRYRPTSIRSHHKSGPGADYDYVCKVLSRIHPENEGVHVFRYLEARARNLVGAEFTWLVIEHLAKTLLDRLTMTSAEIEAAIVEGQELALQELARKPVHENLERPAKRMSRKLLRQAFFGEE